MQLAEAIRAWGRAHRHDLDDRQMEQLGAMYRRVRDTGHGSLDITTMTKDHARSVMLEFDKAERSYTASQLNTVRKWAIAEAAGRAETAEAVVPVTPRNPMATETTILRAPLDQELPLAGLEDPPAVAPPVVEIDPGSLGPTGGVPTNTPPTGPVQGWQPPDQPIDGPQLDRRALALIGAAVLVVLVLAWWVFIRDDSSDATPVITPGVEAEADPAGSTDTAPTMSDANIFFLAEFGIAEDLGQCLVNELGDLATAATNAEMLSRSACGTSLVEVIANAS